MQDFERVSASIALLQTEISQARDINSAETAVAGLASAVLRNKGALLYGVQGRYGGVPGLLGSYKRGTYVIQGTEQLEVAPNLFVGLSDNIPSSNEQTYMVLSTADKRTEEYLKQPNSILAYIFDRTVRIPNVSNHTVQHITAVRDILNLMDDQLTDTTYKPRRLPRPVIEPAHFPPNRVFNMRHKEPPYSIFH